MKNVLALVGTGTVLIAALVFLVLFAEVFNLAWGAIRGSIATAFNSSGSINTGYHDSATPIPTSYHQNGEDSRVFKASNDGVTLSSKLGSNTIKDQGFLMVNLAAASTIALPKQENQPLNIGIVIDRSGSMQGEKLESVKKALVMIAPMLSKRDKVSLVVYDDKVQTLYSGFYDQQKFMSLVSNISSGGSTNLEGGLKEGLTTVGTQSDNLMSISSAHYLNHVILLSDGLANVGMSDPNQLSQMVKNNKGNTTVSTIGVGSDYDENIMTAIARSGEGKYYFLENPNQAESIFTDEFKLISSVVARDIQVELSLERDFSLIRGVGYELNKERPHVFAPHNLSVGRNANYLFELKYQGEREGKVPVGEITMRYFNVAKSEAEIIKVPLTVEVTRQVANPLTDTQVYEEYMRSHVAEQLWHVDRYLDEVKNTEARNVLQQTINDLEAAEQRAPGVFTDDLSKIKAREVYVEAQGNIDITSTREGRLFKKLNQAESFDLQYNK